MCDDAVLVYGGTIKSVPHCYTHQEMCNKAVDNYHLGVIKLSILILLQ